VCPDAATTDTVAKSVKSYMISQKEAIHGQTNPTPNLVSMETCAIASLLPGTGEVDATYLTLAGVIFSDAVTNIQAGTVFMAPIPGADKYDCLVNGVASIISQVYANCPITGGGSAPAAELVSILTTSLETLKTLAEIVADATLPGDPGTTYSLPKSTLFSAKATDTFSQTISGVAVSVGGSGDMNVVVMVYPMASNIINDPMILSINRHVELDLVRTLSSTRHRRSSLFRLAAGVHWVRFMSSSSALLGAHLELYVAHTPLSTRHRRSTLLRRCRSPAGGAFVEAPAAVGVCLARFKRCKPYLPIELYSAPSITSPSIC
jgi:hypothetical protein